MDITKWDDTWGTINWEEDTEDEIIQKIKDFYYAGVDFNMRRKVKVFPGVGYRPKDIEDITILMDAAQYSTPKVIEWLIDGGADMNLRTDMGGHMALDFAAEAGKSARSTSAGHCL